MLYYMAVFTKVSKGEYMNRQEADILNIIKSKNIVNQRELAEVSGHSLGIVNRSIRNLIAEGCISEDLILTQKGEEIFAESLPRNAIILAAGYGMRMVPINTEVPKGLLEVDSEPLIERLIKQLREAGIKDIYIVVGFLK